MDESYNLKIPTPIVDKKEANALDTLTERYNKLMKPSAITQIGSKAVQRIPTELKKWIGDVGKNISEIELYCKTMDTIAHGFKAIEERVARHSVSEKQILCSVNRALSGFEVTKLDEICLVRSYVLAERVNKYKGSDMVAAILEGATTGVAGFAGLPFSIVFSTFFYFRAVQSIAMYYGYDVKNDSAELMIASEVFTNALSPMNNNMNDEATSIIGKIMIMGQAAVVKQAAKKGWADMAARGGVPLLIVQMRALANKAAQKALQKAGAKGLENSVFREALEQIGRRLTLKAVGKSVPVISGGISALIDAAQMQRVLEFADIFYQKRFILEKESRINCLIGN